MMPNSKDFKTAYIDTNKLLEESTEAKDLKAKYEDIASEKDSRIKVEVDKLEIKYSNYITGIGYRNPTGVITGNISYTGGNPVKDVMIVANPTGSSLRFGSSLKVPSDSYIKVAKLNQSLKDSISIQTWMKPYADFGANEVLSLYSLSSDHNETLDFKIKMIGSQLTAYVGAHMITLTNYIPSGEIDNKGQDILVPIANLNKLFTHFSAVLRNNKIPEIYINGRLISAAYAAKMNTILAQNPLNVPLTVSFTSTNTTVQLNTTTTGVLVVETIQTSTGTVV